MFKKARLKLTAWYLLIIMTISLTFSAVIYRNVTQELNDRFVNIQRRFEQSGHIYNMPQMTNILLEDYLEAKNALLFILLYTNGAIFTVSSLLGYFLAGKTLHPIEEAMNEQRRFIADASHELKTPLTSLKTAIEVTLRDKRLSLKDAKKTLNESLDDINSLTNLTTNLLTLAKTESNSNNKKTADTKNSVKKSLKSISPFAKTKKIKIKDDSKSTKIKADPDALTQILTIVLDNAIKYTPKKGQITIITKKSKRNSSITITDSGPGIPKKELEKIFDRFYQIEKSRTKSQNKGFGLGLSIAKKLAEQNNGSIKIKSTSKKGTSVTLKFQNA